MLSIFSLTLAANEAREAAVTGEYFEIRNAVFPIALIELLDRTGAVVSRLENPEQSDFVRPGPYQTVRITNGPTAQTIKHFYGSGDAGSRRTSGLVQIIDNELARSNNGQSFTAHMFAAASTTLFSGVQLYNPAASGVNILIPQFNYNVSGGFALQIASSAVQLTGATGTVGNKKAGAAASMAIATQNQTLATALVSPAPFAASGNGVYRLHSPFVVPPGFGLNFGAPAINAAVSVDVEYFQEAV